MMIENLPKDMESQELKELASDFGDCVSAKIISSGFGEVSYASAQDMSAAVKKLDRRRFDGGDVRLKAYEKRA